METALNTKVGVLGGGQLGRMMGYAAGRLGIHLVILDPLGTKSPAGAVTPAAVTGHFNNRESVLELSKHCDMVTVEIEHINTDALVELEASGMSVQPSSKTLATIQDKYLQKEHLIEHGVAVADSIAVTSQEDIKAAGEKWGFPLMLKNRRLAYDGRGNAVVQTAGDIEAAFNALGGAAPEAKSGGVLYVERWAPFTKELAVMVARSVNGEMASFPVVETIQRDNICHTVIAPAQISQQARAEAAALALKAISTFDGAGIFGVEMFLLPDDSIILNEIAPRPHNSGHYTMEACVTDQFEQHLRAILGLPLGDCSLRVGCSRMINILGDGETASTMRTTGADACLATKGAAMHWYGKSGCKKGRKMGHITITADNFDDLDERTAQVLGTPCKTATA